MFRNGYADSDQLSFLAKFLDDYCTQAGLDARHPARLFLARRLLSFHASGLQNMAELTAALADTLAGYISDPFVTNADNPFLAPERD